jgi:para-aminobenzoate synthetase component 1
MPRVTELPYCEDSAQLFESIANEPWAVFLDSGYPAVAQGCYDVLSADPMTVLVTRGSMTEIRTRRKTMLSPDDPFHLLRRCLGVKSQPLPEVPLCGGAIGYFSYDLGRRLERLPARAIDDERLPEMAVGIYDWAVVVDHRLRRSWLVGEGRDAATQLNWPSLLRRFGSPPKGISRTPFRVVGPVSSNMDRARYASAYGCVKAYIRDGDCYQVNLAQRFTAPTAGDPWLAYKTLRKINPAPFAAYLNTPQAQVLSASPERFLRVTDDRVETKPIKGTCARADDSARDRCLAEALYRSPKDRAENLMIVDLLRNDLGKTCVFGSVKVPKLFELQSFATVHHLVSTVIGRLRAGQHAADLLRACFPGGSVTGAPKLRAMEIIDELEPHRRGVYCGSIGYIAFDGRMDTNIAIRTLVHTRGRMSFWAGGGIVADSSLAGEYQETLDKAAAMLNLLERETRCNRVGS